MKEVIFKEYFRRIRKIFKSKLNGGNAVNAMNSRAVSIIRYSAGIVEWTKDELRKLDRKTRKLLTINRAFHPQADVDRLYLKRATGGRGLLPYLPMYSTHFFPAKRAPKIEMRIIHGIHCFRHASVISKVKGLTKIH